MNVIKPNFIIVGAAKSGTTSVTRYLQDHPEVFMPRWKEPGFYAQGIPGRPETETDYFNLFSKANNHRAIGEASTSYLFDKNAAKKIVESLGQIKIIIMLRNPVDMIFSLWSHNVRTGIEKRDFLTAVNSSEVPESLSSTEINVARFNYLDRAKYCHQILRFTKQFGENNVKTFIFEEFFQDPSLHYKELCQFLEISTDFTPAAFENHNKGAVPRSALISWMVTNRRIFRKIINPITTNDFRVFILKKLTEINRSSKKLTQTKESKIELFSKFENEISELSIMLNRDFDLWRPADLD